MTKKTTITLAGGAEAARWCSGPEGPRGFNSTAMYRKLEAMSLALLELEDDYRAAEAGHGWDPAYGFAAFALDQRFRELCVSFRRAGIWARNARHEHQADAAMAATILLIDRCLSDFQDAERQPAIEAAWHQMQRYRAKGNTPFSRKADRMIHRAFARLLGFPARQRWIANPARGQVLARLFDRPPSRNQRWQAAFRGCRKPCRPC